MKPIGIAVHGGAFAYPEHDLELYRNGCHRALELGLEILQSGGSSVDAVQAAVVQMENDVVFDAGVGSYLDESGGVTLDSAIMSGNDLDVGAVAAVSGVPNPILLARAVLESSHALLVGEGAQAFALRSGVPTCEPDELVIPREQDRWEGFMRDGAPEDWVEAMFGDTVGAVALDRFGNLAAGTSTGGSMGKPRGRVGDTPVIGAGLYADSRQGAAAVTGHGERIIPLLWASRAVDLMAGGLDGPEAAHQSLQVLDRLSAKGGVVVIDPLGRAGAAFNAPYMAYAVWDPVTQEITTGPDSGVA